MPVRRWPGTPTNPFEGGWWWTDVVSEKGWRIQHNKTMDRFTPWWKPFRLLDPKGFLWASADSAEELQDELPTLVEWITSQKPLFTRAEVVEALKTLGPLLIGALSKGKIKLKARPR